MLRRNAKRSGPVSLGNVYEDRSSDLGRKRHHNTHFSDEVDEKKLEELVFGKQLFTVSEPAESTNLFQSEESETVC